MLHPTLLTTLASSYLLATTIVHALSLSSLSQRQYQSPDSELVLTYPACDYYRCIFTWAQGERAYINWENAPTGNVRLQLMNDYSDDDQTVAFEIATVQSPTDPAYCDAGSGVGVQVEGKPCGRYAFIVPSEWQPNKNYSVHAYLEGDESIESFTDFININATEGTFALSAVPLGPSTTATSSDGSTSSAASSSSTTTAATQTGDQTTTTSSASSNSSTSTSATPSNSTAQSTSAAAQAHGPFGLGTLTIVLAGLLSVVGGALLL